MSPRKKAIAGKPGSKKAKASSPAPVYPDTDSREPPAAALPEPFKRKVFTIFGEMSLFVLSRLLVAALSKTKEEGVVYVQLDEAIGETQVFIRERFPFGPEHFVALCLTGSPLLVDSLVRAMQWAVRPRSGAWESPSPQESLTVRAVVVDRTLMIAADEELFLRDVGALDAASWEVRLLDPAAFAMLYATEAP